MGKIQGNNEKRKKINEMKKLDNFKNGLSYFCNSPYKDPTSILVINKSSNFHEQ